MMLTTMDGLNNSVLDNQTVFPALPNPMIELEGKPYLCDAKGSLVPLEMVKPADKIEDEMVRKVIGFAITLSEQISRFSQHTKNDLVSFDELLAQEYNVNKGTQKSNSKGNCTYKSFDGLYKVVVQIQDRFDFGPQLHQAKTLIDECMNEWAVGSRPEIRAIITNAFNTDKEGRVNRTEIIKLLKLDITDERWLEAMRAIRDAMRVIGSKEYIRFYKRNSIEDGWEAITIDLAKA